MDRRVVVPLVLGLAAVGLVALSVGALDPLLTTEGYNPTTPTVDGTDDGTADGTATRTPFAYDHTTVTVVDAETGEELGTVETAIADTYRKKYTGLSKTESLPADRGMLFPYDSEGSHTYVMREMDFGIDIVYIGANGTITKIHHAPEPPEGEDGENYRYPGTGQYVLEVNYEWTTEHNVTEGDRVRIEGYTSA
ncbi:DUF192 domain-containing protein [Halorarius litoreus]|uniref:DUF192 domain-containing protein n=1 Tax=Halorarius litoreus TaxID=2962676 RepID=UPI0020CBCCCE|nr:DUF192 domain-containing protein [Halorarius litoreus]